MFHVKQLRARFSFAKFSPLGVVWLESSPLPIKKVV
jgi:hypothetical protein